MSIVIDLIIVAIIALTTFIGYKKGLTKVVIDILSFFIAIVVAVVLFKPVSNFVIDKTQIDENIKEAVINIAKDDVEEDGKVKEDSNLPQAMVDYINNTVEEAAKEAKNNAVEIAAQKISDISINVGVALLLFIVVRIVLLVVSLIAKFVTELPVIKQFDKAGGIIYGVVKSFVIIFVVLALISFISPMIENTGLIAAIDKSFIGGILYNNNILLKIFFN